jgi:sporadic carbohydrate cluster 2OG-Fe(II) oxygenase
MTAVLPTNNSDFLSADERILATEFLKNGIVKINVEDMPALARIRTHLVQTAAARLQLPEPKDQEKFLNEIHKHISVDKLNEFRLAILGAMGAEKWFKSAYFSLGRKAIETLVGNELAMQCRVNLSIQLPGDDSSLLALHSDVWSGDSPYEVVLWVPYVDCYKTKAMYFTNAAADAKIQSKLSQFKSAEELYQVVAKDAPFIDVNYGEALIFTQNIMHGNRVNEENETRWSSNCRFKSALSPYADKKLGEFFEPITLRPATRLGLRYKFPEAFDK